MSESPARCIFLEISHPRLEAIQALRRELDPLADKIAPHITLVFPFRAEVPRADLVSLLESLVLAKAIPFTLGKATASGTNLSYHIDGGTKEILALRSTIYEMLPGLA